MRDKVIRPERRRPDRRQQRLAALAEVVDESAWLERRVHCWNLEPECTEERRKRCAAHFVRRNCWDLWAAEFFPPGRKPCCHPDQDCSDCPLATAKFDGPLSVYVDVPSGATDLVDAVSPGRSPACCAHLYSVRDPQSERGEGNGKLTFKCQRRHGIVLHSSYVSEVCSCAEHRECTFFHSQ